MLVVDPHPLLHVSILLAELPGPLGPSPEWLTSCLAADALVPLSADDALRAKVRDLLRVGGFKPTGRSKPASEYLLRAANEGTLTSINPLVDICNVVSLHSGLPISVVDAERAAPPFRIGLAPPGATYVFNTSGQTIDIGGLLCLHDVDGPCANAVKDAQRTKTHDGTRRTLTVVWGVVGEEERVTRATTWYESMLIELGAVTSRITPR